MWIKTQFAHSDSVTLIPTVWLKRNMVAKKSTKVVLYHQLTFYTILETGEQNHSQSHSF